MHSGYNTRMTEDELNRLTELLNKAVSENIKLPNLPYNLFISTMHFVSIPAVEVILTTTGKDFLLTDRHDNYWNGWHIPGGFIGYGESLDAACSRVSLKEVGVTCKLIKVVYAKAWENTHPYGAPISIFCVCKITGQEKLTDGTFFEDTPEGTIDFHKAFLTTKWKELTQNHIPVN